MLYLPSLPSCLPVSVTCYGRQWGSLTLNRWAKSVMSQCCDSCTKWKRNGVGTGEREIEHSLSAYYVPDGALGVYIFIVFNTHCSWWHRLAMIELEVEPGIYALKIPLFSPGQKIAALYMGCSLSLSLGFHPAPTTFFHTLTLCSSFPSN